MTQVQLSTAMHCVLVRVGAAGPDGHEAPHLSSTMYALKRRGLVEFRGTRALSRVMRWHVTAKGREWLAADEVRRRAR